MIYNKKEQLTNDLGAKKNNFNFVFLVAIYLNMFTSILNQNPEIINNITLEIMKDLHQLKNRVFKNYPDHKSLNNVLDSVFDTFYKDTTNNYYRDDNKF